MMILTNGLTDIVDEGFLKIANSLVKRLKKANPNIEIVSYEHQSEITDTFICANKFMSNKSVRAACKRHEDVMYIPFPTKKWVMALRVYILSKFSKKLRVVLVLKTHIGALAKFLLKQSGVKIIVFSKESAEFYGRIVGAERVTYLKTGVDTEKFVPVSDERALELKKKYGFSPDKKVVLHVGHLNEGRNICQLMKISDEYQVLLITSTLTKAEADIALKNELLSKPNIRIIDDYIPEIEEIYQLSDVYFFPVVENGHCIDIPLSCMEAAACNKPLVTTRFGEINQFTNIKGIKFLDDFNSETINIKISDALCCDEIKTRVAVLDYDWQKTIAAFGEV